MENIREKSAGGGQLSIMSDRTNKKKFFKKRQGCPLESYDVKEINYKNIAVISKFTSEGGRILPRRVTGIRSDKQRALQRAIKIARKLALIKFCNNHGGFNSFRH